MKDILPRLRQHIKYKQDTKRLKVKHIINNIIFTIALILSIDFCFFVTVGIKYKIICAIFTIFCIYMFKLSKKFKKV
jgi:hypothetical protein